MLVIVARCLQTQSILNRLTIEQWSTIEKSPFSVTSPSFIQYKAVGTIFGLGGGAKKNHTFFQKDTILFISISGISNIH